MKLSVVIGTYNRLELLKQAITSILEQTATPVKVYLTDAGSTDGTIDYLQSIASEQIIPIFVGEKIGQARAYNEVFKILDTPYVCWLSDDNVVVNKGLDIAVEILEANPAIAMVGLKVRDQQGPFVDAPYIGGVSAVGVLNVNQGLLRTKVLKEVGGFCEKFRDYGIDPDLTTKVLFAGYDIVYTKAVAIHHYRNWGPDKNSPEYEQMMEKQTKYKEMYLKKYGKYANNAWFWKLKTSAWLLMRRGLGVQKLLNSSEPVFLDLITRDWHNIMSGRYISLADPIVTKDKPYYLVQHCPAYLRPKSLKLEPLK
ncbi:MAG: glycosyltransferase [Gomphosphaeria aponina SAG 52.96 = DSM 107014]|uniref:Glycosyltransferase n=1 Tax=Gomphosphaeria aponina SAG 52.96 = DSM 107014 TaxID=1521640 RepID=A0A941GTL3_9CHRO|nr:glycosyltransferase [Gomphosphaeria aponina SAG 52.96 = DSM 107014]